MEHSKEAERESNWRRLARRIGDRYSDCRVSNFDATGDAQQMAVDHLRRYADEIEANVAAGANVVFYGPPGTGKDHLMIALLREACRRFVSTEWINGMDLFGEVRDAMDTDERERDILQKYTEPGVLAISDPAPPWGELSQFQGSFLFRLIDARYRARRPTWITVNVNKGSELGGRIGRQVVDRLRDGALTIHCDWKSYRKAQA